MAPKHTGDAKTGPRKFNPAGSFGAIGVIRGLFFEDQWTKVVLRVESASRGSTEVLQRGMVTGEEALPGATPVNVFHFSPRSTEMAERSFQKERNGDWVCAQTNQALSAAFARFGAPGEYTATKPA
jgi:hypothetical protein